MEAQQKQENPDDKLIADFNEWVDDQFTVFDGPPRAYFEEGVNRYIYQVCCFGYAHHEVGPANQDVALVEILKSVFKTMKKEGAVRIVWRKRLELKREHSCQAQGDATRIYARFIGIKANGEPVGPGLWRHPEGEPFRLVSRELLEEYAPDPALAGLDRTLFTFLKPLRAEFGDANVEDAMIFITRSKDWHGKFVMIRPTPEMVRSILEAVHGRLNVGAIRIPGIRP